jgi:hypothetical protein
LTKITVYRFTVYDITTDERRRSLRWATREAIKRVGGDVLEDTATEVDDAAVEADGEPGMTVRGFDPHRGAGGFQRSVKP